MRIRVRFCRRQTTFRLLFSYFRLFYEMFSHTKKCSLVWRFSKKFYNIGRTGHNWLLVSSRECRTGSQDGKKHTFQLIENAIADSTQLQITMGPFFYDFSVNSMRIRFLIVLRRKTTAKKRFSFVYRIGLLFVRACLYADDQTKLYSLLLLFTFLCLENINLNKFFPFPFRLYVRKLIKIKK